MQNDGDAAIERDTWFNPHLGPNTSTWRAHDVIGVPLLAVKTHKRKRALTGANLDTFSRVMIALLANLIHHYLSGSPGDGIPVPRSNKELGKKANRYEPLSFPRSFPKMLDALRDLGFAEVTLGKYSGFPGQSKRTTVRAGPKLIELIEEHKVTLDDLDGSGDLEIIILKRPKRGYGDEGERVDYKDTATGLGRCKPRLDAMPSNMASTRARTGMNEIERHAHWENVYQTKGEREVSWFAESPALSLDLIRATGVTTEAPVIDIGGGASRLVDALLHEGFSAITVLDLSEKALATSKARLGERASKVNWIAADVTTWEPPQTFEVWHDRATFHFLVDAKDRAAYAKRTLRAVRPGGHLIIGTFALDGPEQCSGLPVVRYDAASLSTILGPSFQLMESRIHSHQTPMGTLQHFQFSRFRRLN